MELARIHYENGQFLEAARLCDEALRGGGAGIPDVLYFRGVIETQVGNLYSAIEYLRQAIEKNSNDEYYHYNLGVVFDLLGEAEEAISCYEQALTICPDMAIALNSLGHVFYKLGKKERAKAYFTKAIHIDPHFEFAKKNLELTLRKGIVRIAQTCTVFPSSIIDPEGGEISLGDHASVGRYSQLLAEGGKIEIGARCIVQGFCLIEGLGGEISIKNDTALGAYAQILAVGGKIEIGARCSVQSFCQLYGHGGLTIGNNVRIAAQTITIPSNHNFDRCDALIADQGTTDLGITIGDDVWIGAGCKILDGVTIGSGCVIGAGSVVTKSIPPYSVAVGSPAKVIRKRGEVRKKSELCCR